MTEMMKAVVLTGHGGLDKLVYQDVAKPVAGPGEVLIQVGACGLNNTDVNTRSGWYSKEVTSATTGEGLIDEGVDGTWGGSGLSFPRIQGADVCGEIAAVGEGVDAARIGERIVTDNWIRDPADPENKAKTRYFGSELNGGFAEFVVIPAENALAVNSPLSDAELATFSCSYSTAEGMLTRAKVGADDTVLVPGASGGVGGALVQLAKLRGARVVAMAGEAKHEAVLALGADRALPRAPEDLAVALEGETITVLADIVGGDAFAPLIELIERGGRYVTSGAIAGPIVPLDLRTLYLRDLTFHGSTVVAPEVMRNVVRYVEEGSIRPALAATYPLENLREAQAAFIAKTHVGNIVVTP